jgi:UPF0755 protein
MRRTKRPLNFTSLILGTFAILLAAFLVYSWQRSPVNSDTEDQVLFIIESGQGLDSIGRALVDAGLIRSVAGFKLQVFLSGAARNIQAGDFILSPSQNLVEIVNSLRRGRTDRRVVLREGLRREEYALVLEQVLGDRNPDFRFDGADFVAKTATLEGKLFPETYDFQKNATADQVIERLVNTFRDRTESVPNQSGLSNQDALILASVVERESATNAERPIVAGILLNRYRAGMPLQADATVQYAKANATCRQLECNWWPTITRADYSGVVSAYSTYTNVGLPPAPISNPSSNSIRAAFQPQSTEYWYYIHANDEIYYARTLEEHNSNVSRYLR